MKGLRLDAHLLQPILSELTYRFEYTYWSTFTHILDK